MLLIIYKGPKLQKLNLVINNDINYQLLTRLMAMFVVVVNDVVDVVVVVVSVVPGHVLFSCCKEMFNLHSLRQLLSLELVFNTLVWVDGWVSQ